MKLILRRVEYGYTYTIGKLYVNADFECWVLEDRVRDGKKIWGETAIPAGIYKVVIDHSERFGKDYPHLLDVPGFEGVRIHSGNSSKDTEGCLLVGTTLGGGDRILGSRDAYASLFPKIQKALETEEVTINIIDTN